MQNEPLVISKPINYGGRDTTVNFTFKKLKPSKSIKFLMYMGKIIGGSAGNVIGSFDGQVSSLEDFKNIKEENLDFEKLGQALVRSLDNVNEDEAIEKLNLLLSSVESELAGNRTMVHVDLDIFKEEFGLIGFCLVEALRKNYQGFFKGGSGVLEKIIQSVKIMQNGKS